MLRPCLHAGPPIADLRVAEILPAMIHPRPRHPRPRPQLTGRWRLHSHPDRTPLRAT